MLIICDVDGVLADLHTPWCNRYNADYGQFLTPADITTWSMLDHVIPECGPDIYRYLLDPTLYDEVGIYEGTPDYINALRALGHQVLFVTSCNGPMMEAKYRWLQNHGFLPPQFDYSDEYVTMSAKWHIDGDVIIDDRWDTCVEWARKRGKPAILFAQPWNDQPVPADVAHLVFRVDGWPAVLESIHVYAKAQEQLLRIIEDRAQDAAEQPSRAQYETILDEAKSLVYGDREAAYSHPYYDFTRVARVWSGYLDGAAITPSDVAMMMVLLKACRARVDVVHNRPFKRDTIVDIAGYAECARRVNEREIEIQDELIEQGG